jgi:hypothetical protein
MSDEKTVEVVGEYLIVSWRQDSSSPQNPLENDDYAGQIHGNFSDFRQHFGSIGEEHEFRSARGNLNSEGNLQSDDYLPEAALLVIAETPFDEALEAMEEHLEWDEAQRADEASFRADVMREFGKHVMDQYSRSWPKIPNIMWDQIIEKAEALAMAAVEARTVGNKYAVPMSQSGHYTMTLEPDLGKDIAEMDKSDILWIPSSLAVEDLDALPYGEAMVRAVALAKSDGEAYAQWACNEVFDGFVDVYRLAFEEDDDDEPITDPDFYEDNGHEPEHSLNSYECLGSDYADQQLEALVVEAKAWVAEQEAELGPDAEAASSSPSMSM